MSNKAWEAMKVALHSLSPNEKNIVITSDGTPSDSRITVCTLKGKFTIKNALAAIGDTKIIGVIDSDKLNETHISKLINILISDNKATVVRVSTNPISCKILYPIPEIGTKHINGNYEYCYGKSLNWKGVWENTIEQNGWGVRVVDNTQTDYESPLTMIQGGQVTNMQGLFFCSSASTLNLIDWDTSNVTDMHRMFSGCKATNINGLSNFDTSNVTDMSYMFYGSQATNLNLSKFNTSKVTCMNWMFSRSQATNIDLSSFDTSNVTSMLSMFSCSGVTELDLSSFDISKVTTIR